uniref:Uncharacterized protein n=1 Tax=Rhizophora mucronata TaxID=61149 RepID=A0A2P2MMW5_RHIMU
MEKNKGKTMEDALSAHMSTCTRFNKLGKAYPVLLQAEAMREILKKSTRSKSVSPKGAERKVGGIARSSSCMPAITREMQGLTLAN